MSCDFAEEIVQDWPSRTKREVYTLLHTQYGGGVTPADWAGRTPLRQWEQLTRLLGRVQADTSGTFYPQLPMLPISEEV